LSGVLTGLAETAKANKGISFVMHDIRTRGDSPAHAGTQARLYVTQMELKEILATLNTSGFKYETFEEICEYGKDLFDKPEVLL
jgi:hypothetical protein